jgi:hypothetical protein
MTSGQLWVRFSLTLVDVPCALSSRPRLVAHTENDKLNGLQAFRH